jgi:hypothetical protein
MAIFSQHLQWYERSGSLDELLHRFCGGMGVRRRGTPGGRLRSCLPLTGWPPLRLQSLSPVFRAIHMLESIRELIELSLAHAKSPARLAPSGHYVLDDT